MSHWQSWQNPDKKWVNTLTFPVLHSTNYRYQTSYYRATARNTASPPSNSKPTSFNRVYTDWFLFISKVSICLFQPYQLNVTRMNNFVDTRLHHGWKKLWNSLHLERPICTHLHHGWRKFWNSMSLDAPRTTNLYSTSPWLKKLLKFQAPACT